MSTTWSTVNPNPAGDSSTNAVTVQFPADTAVLTASTLLMSGVSAPLVDADPDRKIVIVANGVSNSSMTVDPTGGTATGNLGVPIAAGGLFQITGVQAQAAMTQFGTNGQTITIYTG